MSPSIRYTGMCERVARRGFVLTIVATRALAGLLFGIGPLDPIALAGTAGVLIVVAVVASVWPAARAAAVAPAVAMRAE